MSCGTPMTSSTPTAQTAGPVAGVLLHSGNVRRAAVFAGDAITQWRELGEPDLLGMVDGLCVRACLHRAAGEPTQAEAMGANRPGTGDSTVPAEQPLLARDRP